MKGFFQNTVKYFTNPGNYKNARETEGLVLISLV